MTNKDLVKQYCNTGISISKEQFFKLNIQDRKTYLRARFMAFKVNGNLHRFELDNLPEDKKIEAVNDLIDMKGIALVDYFHILTQENKIKAIHKRIFWGENKWEQLEEKNLEDFIFVLKILKEMFLPGFGGENLQNWWKQYDI